MFAITSYSVALGLHSVFAISFLGAAGAFKFIGDAAKKSPQNLGFALGIVRQVQEKVMIPGFVGIIATGSYQISKGNWELGDNAWLIVSLAIFAAMLATFFGVTYPGVKRAQQLVTEVKPGPEGGPPVPPPELIAILQRQGKLGPILGLGLIAIAFLMSAKPF